LTPSNRKVEGIRDIEAIRETVEDFTRKLEEEIG
jgi:hypothetical protein